MENEVRLIECRSCAERNCKGCNVYTLSKMLQRGDFDCMMDEHHSIALTPESLRPKGRWEPRKDAIGFVRCSVCHDCNIYGDWADGEKWRYCPNCGADMREVRK